VACVGGYHDWFHGQTNAQYVCSGAIWIAFDRPTSDLEQKGGKSVQTAENVA
jgi:hypothetical protein